MALENNAAMVLFYDVEGNPVDHDDWQSHEHFHERLSVPGFRRATRWVATRWVATGGTPRNMLIYELSDVDVGTSQSYLDRLNDPTDWTREMMPRFRGMTRGFCRVAASHGLGQGNCAFAMRFTPKAGADDRLSDWISHTVLPDAASRRGMTGVHLLAPTAPPPMTREQALRGPDEPMPWLVMATAYDADALERTVTELFQPDLFREHGAGDEIAVGRYALHHTATAAEAQVTPQPPVLDPEQRAQNGPRL